MNSSYRKSAVNNMCSMFNFWEGVKKSTLVAGCFTSGKVGKRRRLANVAVGPLLDSVLHQRGSGTSVPYCLLTSSNIPLTMSA